MVSRLGSVVYSLTNKFLIDRLDIHEARVEVKTRLEKSSFRLHRLFKASNVEPTALM